MSPRTCSVGPIAKCNICCVGGVHIHGVEDGRSVIGCRRLWLEKGRGYRKWMPAPRLVRMVLRHGCEMHVHPQRGPLADFSGRQLLRPEGLYAADSWITTAWFRLHSAYAEHPDGIFSSVVPGVIGSTRASSASFENQLVFASSTSTCSACRHLLDVDVRDGSRTSSPLSVDLGVACDRWESGSESCNF